MRVLVGFFILLVFYFFGQFISLLIGNVIPGNIIGMILLFLALYFKLLKPAYVRSISSGLTKNMAVLFVPAGVGLLTATDLVSKYWVSILVASAISSVLVIATVALIQQKMENKRLKK